MGAPASSYWVSLANAYAEMRSPLRPCDEDIRFYENTVAAHTASDPAASIQALLLGVTPSIAAMRWPLASSLLAIDGSVAMAKAVWPGDVAGKRWAVCGNWLTPPKRDSSCDVVIGDGAMNCLRFPDDCRRFSRSIRALLKPGGLLVLRCYTQPDVREEPAQVLDDAISGMIPTFTHFKFRLLMAMQASPFDGVAVESVYRFWADHEHCGSLLMARNGWPSSEMDTMQLYRGSSTVHTFPTLAGIREALSECFEEVAIHFPSYFDGQRCPSLVLRPHRGLG